MIKYKKEDLNKDEEPLQETEKVEINYLPLLIEDAKEHGRAICPLCKLEKERELGQIYEKRNVQVSGDFAFCFRCKTKFVDTEKAVKTNDFTELDFMEVEEKQVSFEETDCSFIWDLLEEVPKNVMDYLLKRNPYLSKDFIESLFISGDKNRIIIPFFSKDKIIYYQFRYIRHGKLKYFNPPTSYKPFWYKSYSPLKPTLIVEGVFDALAILCVTNEYNVLASIGSTISTKQFEKLMTMNVSSITVFMDDLNKTFDLCKKLRYKKYKGPLYYIEAFYDRDSEELLKSYGKEGFLRYLKDHKFKWGKNEKKKI